MRKFLFMLDFDGTLVPIADYPDAIVVPPELPNLLITLRQHGHEVIIITGRPAKDVKKHFKRRNIPIIGLHGLQKGEGDARLMHEVMQHIKPLESEYPGLLVENKHRCVAVHYRGVAKNLQKKAYQALQNLFIQYIHQSNERSKDKHLSMLDGNMVLELRPVQASKAHAVERLIHKYPHLHPLYMGDDTTDEEAFAAMEKRGTTILVGKKRKTLAKHRLTSVYAVLKFLRQIAKGQSVHLKPL